MPVGKSSMHDISEYYPTVCTETPAFNSAFCSEHTRMVQESGFRTNIREFITDCGGDPNRYSKEERAKVNGVLKGLLQQQDGVLPTAEEDQGVEFLLNNNEVLDPDILKPVEKEGGCNKNTGLVFRMYNWSRGIFQIVAGSGHILYWAPIYEHESPHQAAFLIVKFLSMKLEGKTEEDYRNYYVAYDNICAGISICIFQLSFFRTNKLAIRTYSQLATYY